MFKSLSLSLALVGLCSASNAQSLLFDFDNAPIHTPLPIDIQVGSLNAHFTYQFYGYSIQAANTYYQPVGFAGNCIFPNTVYRDDLFVDFSQPITEFSMMFSPQELATGTTATMRVTAFSNGTQVGTSTAKAPGPGTWPVGQLVLNAPQGFDRVVVHYDAPPSGGGDYGVIFMADNMAVTPLGEGSTEVLAPISQTVNVGKLDSGNVNRLGVQDGSSETICKAFVPSFSSPFVRLTLNYQTTKPNPSRIEFFTTSRMANTGTFVLRLSMYNQATASFDQIMTDMPMADVFRYGVGRPYEPYSDYVSQTGAIQGRIEVFRTGFAAVARPCVDFDQAVMKVSG